MAAGVIRGPAAFFWQSWIVRREPWIGTVRLAW